LPESFVWVSTLSLARKTQEDYVFAKKTGGKPLGTHATRAYLKKLIDKPT
jgi:integrase/recombinase XerD